MQRTSHAYNVGLEWHDLVRAAVRDYGTPCYVCRLEPICENAERLAALLSGVTTKQWLAVKAHPVRDVLRAWKHIGYGAEVVSPFELEAAVETGYEAKRILVNGVGKHLWLRDYKIRGLRVHLDSIAEAETLLDHARKHEWLLGFRYHPSMEYDPDEPHFEDQFGFNEAELAKLVQLAESREVRLLGVHFHLRSNVRTPIVYRSAIQETIRACHDQGIRPSYLDCGGGLPVSDEVPLWEDGNRDSFDMAGYGAVLKDVPRICPSAQEVWLENGRFISSDSTVLVVRVIDIKDRPSSRYIICDGGRTNHAIVSEWQRNPVCIVPNRTGPMRLTTICGPTCMAYDRLARLELPVAIQPGDLLVWKNAGAYHVPWETRFSFGCAAVVVVGLDGVLRLARQRESFSSWWGVWRRESAE